MKRKKGSDPHYEALAVFLFLLGLVALLAGGCAKKPHSDTLPAKQPLVASQLIVSDGDTIQFTDHRTAIRLLQINAPDKDECYGPQAYRYLKRVVARDTDLAVQDDSKLKADRYERSWMYLSSKQHANVGLDMVRRGLAVPYFLAGEQGDHSAAIQQAADDAKRAGRGLWHACKPDEVPAQR